VGGDHFTAMVKPPGTKSFAHVDPTGFIGPQWTNRKQCGGYSAMIEAQAIKRYSSLKIPPNGTIIESPSSFRQFVDEVKMKIATWFAGNRNKVKVDDRNEKVDKSRLETTYGEMADFNAGILAESFDNKEYTAQRIDEEQSSAPNAPVETNSLDSNSIADWDDTEEDNPSAPQLS
jgi:hypothetical protein